MNKLLVAGLFAPLFALAEPVSFSGIYPSLATFNEEGECGTGAVVPWADHLWLVTYGPHKPYGSSDKLYEITPDLERIVRPESIGGTPADRLIHRESQQLFIGPYAIDAERRVRVIPWQQMPGRLTGAARHLSDPANKIYIATMEAGLYEVDVHTLAVTGLLKDRNPPPATGAPNPDHPATVETKLPGWHGKGLYSGQGRLVFANNGEHGKLAETDPDSESGALGEFHGAGDYTLVRRTQFTEISGPGGIYGNAHPETDPVWALGWDRRSVILMCLDQGAWHPYRLPKASHTYDGAHGYHTEWPRIREIGEDDLLMNTHGGLWRFPKAFSVQNSAGIAPRSTELCVTGDFCRWNERVVFGCDVSAKSEFLNTPKAKGGILSAGQAQSNLWFLKPEALDALGPPLGRGAVWWNDPVKTGIPSDPYLFGGYTHRCLWLKQSEAEPVTFTLEVDEKGDDHWKKLREIEAPPHAEIYTEFTPAETGAWIRLTANRDCASATAFFHARADDPRETKSAALFDGLATPADAGVSGGFLYARGGGLRTLALATADGYYELDGEMQLRRKNDPQAADYVRKGLAIPKGFVTSDGASALYTDEKGRRWRLPKGDAAFDAPGPLGDERADREVVTERDLFNCHGTLYELPAESSGGFGKIRPIATHNRRIKDYATYRGMLILSGLTAEAHGPHIIRSDDGRVALWAGAIDDLWQLGKPRGTGGPWKDSAVQAGEPSDAYLATGYDHKRLSITHQGKAPIIFRVEADVSGEGTWLEAASLRVNPGETVEHRFPESLGAYWFRIIPDQSAVATATFIYD